jgi:hypothetical protein
MNLALRPGMTEGCSPDGVEGPLAERLEPPFRGSSKDATNAMSEVSIALAVIVTLPMSFDEKMVSTQSSNPQCETFEFGEADCLLDDNKTCLSRGELGEVDLALPPPNIDWGGADSKENSSACGTVALGWG